MRRFLMWLSARRPFRVINGEDGQPYLRRFHLFYCLGITVDLHHFVASDPDRGLHDHPWGWACSLVLAGGYLERELVHAKRNGHLEIRDRWIGPGRLNWIRGDKFHRIILGHQPLDLGAQERHAWTLFIHGPRRKGWGFMRYVAGDDWRFDHYEPYVINREWHDFKWWKDAPLGRDAVR